MMNLKFYLLTLLMFICISSHIYAQEAELTGLVRSSQAEPLKGVSVFNSTSSQTVQTSEDGSFSIQASVGDIIVFRYVGYQTLEHTVANFSPLSITLSAQDELIEEVVIMGYGTIKRNKVTASVSTLDSKILETGVRANPAQALAGTIPGLRVTTGSGRPGSLPGIVLRGGTHFDGSGSPLILVDGQVRGSLSDISPDQIERIDVQKDAAATAIYGARASNGVILITTKKGKEGVTRIEGKANVGINYLNVPYEFLSAEDYIKWSRLSVVEAIKNGTIASNTLSTVGPRGTGNKYFDTDNKTPLDGNYANEGRWSLMRLSDDNKFLLNQGWRQIKDAVPTDASGNYDPNGTYADLIFEDFNFGALAFNSPAPTQDYSVSFSGGNDKGKYYSNLNFYDEKGLTHTTFYKRLNYILNAEYKLQPWLTSQSSFQYGKANWKDQSLTNGEANYWGRMLSAPPTLRSRSPITGEYILGRDASDGNPLVNIDKFIRKNQTDKFTMNQAFVVDLLPELTMRSNGIIHYEEGHYESFDRDYRTGLLSYTDPDAGWNRNRYSSASFSRDIQQTYNVVFNYSKDFDVHHLDAMVGGEFYESYIKGLGANGSLAPTDDFPSLDYTQNNSDNPTRGTSSNHSKDRIVSQFARVNYDYDDKYIASVTVRRDGVSRLNSSTRFGTFPAFSLGWVMSNEEFLSGARPIINYLKLKGSWGQSGNIGIGTNYAIGRYEVQGAYNAQTPYQGETGFLLSDLANPTLRWEKSTTLEFGVESGLFNNRLNANLSVYSRSTVDKLSPINLPISSGFSGIRTNNGSMRNNGVELDLDAKIISKNDFSWSLGANAAWVKNKIVKLPFNGNENNRQGGQQVYDPNTGELIWVGGHQEGHQWGDVYGFFSEGIIRNEEDLANYNVRDDAAGVAYGIGAAPGKKVASQKVIDEQGLSGYLPTALGDMMWKDVNGDGVIDQSDMVYLGNVLPRWTGGVNTTLQYKGLSLFARIDFATGHIQMDRLNQWSLGAMQGEFNATNIVQDTWTPDNPNAKYPRYVWADQLNQKNYDRPNNLFWVNSSYLAFRELSLSYSIPESIVSKAKMNSLVLTVTGQNLGYISNKLLNLPERTGETNSGYTIPTILLLGIKTTF